VIRFLPPKLSPENHCDSLSSSTDRAELVHPVLYRYPEQYGGSPLVRAIISTQKSGGQLPPTTAVDSGLPVGRSEISRLHSRNSCPTIPVSSGICFSRCPMA
jgi:hypothetical protein